MGLASAVEQTKTGVLHILFAKAGEVIASGSAFWARGYLITNNHVFAGPPDSVVILRTCNANPDDPSDGIHLPYQDFAKRLVSGSDEDNLDYAVLDVPEFKDEHLFSFDFGDPSSRKVGDEVYFLGYPFEHLNLVCHSGIVSSFMKSGPARVIQLDASVNHSNSGGPLIDPTDNSVIGLVTRKATGLSRLFRQLQDAFDNNIAALENAKGIMSLGAVDPVAALLAGQHQMKQLAREIERSANVGIGYAFSIEHVASDSLFQG